MIHRRSLVRHRAPCVHMAYEVEIHGVTRRVELPFVTGVLADLSGQPEEPPPPVSERTFMDIDRANFDTVMAAMGTRAAFRVPNLLTGIGDLNIDLRFRSLADFSPVAVARQDPGLRHLLDERRRLADAAGDGGSGGGTPQNYDWVAAGWRDGPPSAAAIAALIAKLDRALDRQLNAILHAEAFQRLESSWRGLHYFVSHTETDEMSKIRVLDISKKELAKELKKFMGIAWEQSPIYHKIFRDEYNRSGGEPFGCLVGDYAFDHSPWDVDLLASLARICAAAHVPFLAAASPAVMQMDSWRELPQPRDLSKIFSVPEYAAWRALRDSEDARYLGLTLPRFLARPPYRRGTAPGHEFRFEEDIGELDHGKLVWATTAYAMAANIHRAFNIHGWCSRIVGLESGGAVEGLPLVTQETGHGCVEMLCPTEIAIDEKRQAELAALGFIALVHRKGSDIAVFSAANSLCKPAEDEYDPDVTANARRAAQLPHLFATCRLAHYLKAIIRDKAATFRDRESLQEWLNQWVSQYVDPDPATQDAFQQSPRPFAAAEIVVEPVPGESGAFTAEFFLRPHLFTHSGSGEAT